MSTTRETLVIGLLAAAAIASWYISRTNSTEMASDA